MTAEEMIILAKDWSDEDYDNPTWLKYLNAGLDDLTPISKILKRTGDIVLVIAANGSASVNMNDIAMPTDMHVIVTAYINGHPLRKLPANDPISAGWKSTADTLLFQNITPVGAVILTLDYYKKLSHATVIGFVPEIPTEYHPLLVLYMCAKSKAKEQELNEKNDFYMEYMQGKAAMAMGRAWDMEPFNRRILRGNMVLGVGGRK